jgi:hypothetical protein
VVVLNSLSLLIQWVHCTVLKKGSFFLPSSFTLYVLSAYHHGRICHSFMSTSLELENTLNADGV